MLKKVISTFLVSFMMVSVVFGKIASAKVYGTKATSGSYNCVANTTNNGYEHHIYKNTKVADKFYTGKRVTMTIKHKKNSGEDVLTFSTSQSASKTKTQSWSTNESISSSLGADIDVFNVSVSTGVSLGYGNSYAKQYSYTRNSVSAKTIKSSATTGYYTRVPGYTYNRMRDLAINPSKGKTIDIYYRHPYGAPVLYTIYSKDNKSNWKIY